MLDLKFTICQKQCDELLFTDTTGDYVAVTNEGGWGAPNLDRANVTSSFLNILGPDGVLLIIDITADVIAGTLEICITSALAGLSGDFADGIYEITWTVSDATTQYQECVEEFLFCQAKCKVDKLIAGLELADCCCTNKSGNTTADNVLLAFTLLKGLESAACCYKITKFNDLLAAIDAISKITCKNC